MHLLDKQGHAYNKLYIYQSFHLAGNFQESGSSAIYTIYALGRGNARKNILRGNLTECQESVRKSGLFEPLKCLSPNFFYLINERYIYPKVDNQYTLLVKTFYSTFFRAKTARI